MRPPRTRKLPVPYERIRKMLDEGRTVYAISQLVPVPNSVIDRIKKGRVVEFYNQRNWPGRVKYEPEMCQCCGVVPIDPDLHFNCMICHRRHSDSERRAEC